MYPELGFMNKNLVKILRNCLLMGGLIIPSRFIPGDDIFKGVRGPTNWQLDSRAMYSKNDADVKSFKNALILKYWDGDKSGKWGFIHVPYNFIDSPSGDAQGFGDVSFGAGPRFSIDCFHLIPYMGLKLPTGDTSGKVTLGDGRYDIKSGLFATYLTKDKLFEIDGSLEYAVTGENKKGVNPADELAFGLLVGGKITETIRAGTGFTDLIKDGDYVLNARSVLRYTFSPRFHAELVGDVGIRSRDIPLGFNVGLFFRYNF